MNKSLAKLFIISLFFLSSCSPSTKNIDSQGKAIVCFGDSITYGIGSDPGCDYPAYLKEILGMEIVNAGLSGDTTQSALNRLERDVLEYQPYIVIVELGGNDFLKNVPKEETVENLENIINKIQQKGSMVALCDTSGSFIFRTYKSDYKKLAKKTGAIFIPGILAGILETPSLKYDQIHPNSKGYKIIAQRVYKAIKPYIKLK